MDTANFILARTRYVEQLQARRARDLSSYPFRMGEDYGIQLPAWARLALSFVTRGSAVGKLLEVGLPLAVPFFLKRKVPFVERLVQRFFSPKS